MRNMEQKQKYREIICNLCNISLIEIPWWKEVKSEHTVY